jgi:RAB6A-GEF complex partner protein 2
MPSDIQVFIRFKEQSVFAGEEIHSIITFRNVAGDSDSTPDTKIWQSRGWAAPGNAVELSRLGGSGGLNSQNPRLAAINSHGARKTSNSGHRTTASVTIPTAGSSVPRTTSWAASPVPHPRPSHKHQRSVSIISLSSPDVGNEEPQRAVHPPRSRPTINHSISASIQIHQRRYDGAYDGPSSCEPPCLCFEKYPLQYVQLLKLPSFKYQSARRVPLLKGWSQTGAV